MKASLMPEQDPSIHKVEETTLPAAFLRVTDQRSARPAIREKKNSAWCTISWADYANQARHVGLGLIALGLKQGDRVGILSHGNPQWLFSDMGTLGAGGVTVGIYTTSAPAQVEYLLRDCQARFLFVGNRDQLERSLAVRTKTPSLEKVIVFDPVDLSPATDPMVIGFNTVIDLGRSLDEKDPGLWDRRVHQIRPDDLAILIYTSGTTGPPKGAMISHRNIMFQASVQDELLPIGQDDELISFLPLSHIGERLLGDFRPMLCGSVVNFAESQDKLFQNIREISPTVFFAVPRIWEKFHSVISEAMAKAAPLQRRLYRTALVVGDKVARYRLADQPVPRVLAEMHQLAEKLGLKPLRGMIGMTRTRFVICGAAPVSPEMIRWFLALGLDMRETYGLTESSGVVSITPIGWHKPGTVGKPLPGTELRIAPDGEILVKGDHVFQGYLNMPEETARTIIDGWLHTGDLGKLDEDAFLTITGRKKDVIITAGGKNVSPSEIENQLKFSPLIADAMVVGDGRKYLACLIIPNQENVKTLASRAGVTADNLEELCRSRPIMDTVQAAVDEANAQFSRAEQIKKYRLLFAPLVPGSDEVTATMKLKREAMARKYAHLIEEMYKA